MVICYQIPTVTNVLGVHNVMHKGIHTAEPLVTNHSLVEVKYMEKFKTYKSPGTYQIPAELIKAEGEILSSVTQTCLFYME
jgi:hypothetical protein